MLLRAEDAGRRRDAETTSKSLGTNPSFANVGSSGRFVYTRNMASHAFFFSSIRRHTRFSRDWSSDVCSSDLDVPIDAQIAEALLDVSRGVVGVDHDAHRAEHAVEVELPFLQLLRADVRIVPLVLAWDAWDAARLLGEMLARLVQAAGEPVLLLASSDMNHYEPAGVTEQKDAQALEAIRALDGAELLARCRRERISMCGRGPAATVIAAARVLGAERAEVVDYRHSGWVSGDNARVVGYAGVVIP